MSALDDLRAIGGVDGGSAAPATAVVTTAEPRERLARDRRVER